MLERQIDYGAKLGHVVLSLARMELNNFYKNVTPVSDFYDQRGMLISVSDEHLLIFFNLFSPGLRDSEVEICVINMRRSMANEVRPKCTTIFVLRSYKYWVPTRARCLSPYPMATCTRTLIPNNRKATWLIRTTTIPSTLTTQNPIPKITSRNIELPIAIRGHRDCHESFAS